jgi:predicted ATP-grasp superfamily ATP-dependent carboligase
VTAIDAFGDRDYHPRVRSLALQRHFGVPFSAAAAARVARDIECDAVVYLSNFENHPRAVAELAKGRILWGNPPAVLRHVRDPTRVTRALRERGIATPAVMVGRRDDPSPVAYREHRGRQSRVVDRWLVKPFKSGGGHGVRLWQHAELPRGYYRQEFLNGTSGSVVFVAAGGHAVPLGFSRQLVGEDEFGATGYKYCGSVLAGAGDPQFAGDERLSEALSALTETVAERFGLVGVNGIDFIACDGSPFAVEVNPRWSASMELIERAYGLSVFEAHASACASGALPAFQFTKARQRAGTVGKAVVFARRDVTVGDTDEWLSGRAAGHQTVISDIPHRGERIPAGRPVCTVFAAGRDGLTCHGELVRCASRIYDDLARWEQAAEERSLK